MSFRSPTPDGLAVSPNGGAFGSNPAATPQELQAHHYWGRWAAPGDLPNNSVANLAGAPAYDKLAPGDVGFVQSDSCLYVCTDRGTLGGGDAVWACMTTAALTQTIRDAHVIVVAQASHLNTLATLASPPLATNGLNLGGVGDIVGITCDYLDPGDCSELTFALAAAVGAAENVDVRLRPCAMTLDPTLAPLVVGGGTRLIGAGKYLSLITGGDGTGATTQEVLNLTGGGSVEDLFIDSPAPVATTGGIVGNGVIQCDAPGASILRCAVYLARSVTEFFGRKQTAAIRCTSPGDLLVEDCTLLVDSLATEFVAGTSYGIRLSSAVVGTLPFGPQVRNVTIDENTKNAGSATFGISSVDVDGGYFVNVVHQNIRADLAIDAFSVVWVWSTILGSAAIINGPKIHACRAYFTNHEGANAAGFTVAITGAQDIAGVYGSEIHDCLAHFIPAAVPNVAITKYGFRLAQAGSTAGFGDLRDTTLDNCKALRAHRGVIVDGSVQDSRIVSVRVQSCQARDTQSTGSEAARGMIIRGAGVGNVNPNVLDVGVHNCDFGEANGVTGVGLEIDDPYVDDTIVLGNNLKTSTGAALTDVGTGTEAAHNIVL